MVDDEHGTGRRGITTGSWRIGAQLVLGTIAFAVAALFALHWFVQPPLRAALEERALEDVRLITRGIAFELDRDLGEVRDEILGLRAVIGDERNAPVLDSILARADVLSPMLRGFTVLDSSGIVVSRPRVPERAGVDRSDREYFQAVSAGADFHLGSVRTAASGDLSLLARTPLPGGWVLMASLALADRNPRLYQSVLGLSLPSGWSAWALDRDGRVLVHSTPPMADVALGTDLRGHPTSALEVDATATAAETLSFAGEDWVVGAASGPEFELRVIVIQPAVEVAAALRAVMLPTSITVLLIVSSLAFLALAMLFRMNRPLARLADALEDYGRGSEPVLLPETEGPVAGAIASFNAMVEDRRRVERRLTSTETRLQELFAKSGDGIYIRTPDDAVVVANAAFCEMFGIGVDELESFDAAAAYVRPEDRTALWEELRAKGAVRDREVLLRRANGEEFWVSATVTLLDVEGTGRETTLGIIRDVSERRSLSRQLHEARRLEAVGRLAGGVAHDFNNILTIILGYLDMIEEDHDLPDDARESLRHIRLAGQRGADLVSQLLAFGRKQVRRPVALDMGAVLRDLTPLVRRLVPESISLMVVTPDEVVPVLADRTQVEQLVMNLVMNARDAMPGGGSLTVEVGEAHIDEEMAERHADVAAGRYALLAVSDSGEGMDRETQERIFEPFFTTKELGRGSGLGLATVHGIVRQNGGHIWLYSELGRGTEFKVHLPLASATPEHAAPTVAPSPESLRGTETVLIVEDSTPIRDLMDAVLAQSGYTTHVFGDGEAALAWARGPGRDVAVDLLLTDVVLPGMSGRDLAEDLLVDRPDLRVLYVSGYTDNTVVHHGVLDPGTWFLQKPFSTVRLRARIRELLDAPGGMSPP